MNARPRTDVRLKGQPLMALVAVPLAWALLRFATMDATMPVELTPSPAVAQDMRRAAKPKAAFPAADDGLAPPERWLTSYVPAGASPSPAISRPDAQQPRMRRPVASLAQPPAVRIVTEVAPVIQALPADVAPNLAGIPDHSTSRWQVDAWLALREGSQRIRNPGTALPLYGGSQTGAVLRYRLAVGSRHRPAGYLRAVHALGRSQETDLAIGLAALPLPSLPLTAHAEARIALRGDRTEILPAAFVTTGIDEAPLPFGARLRGYAQMGYAGGRDQTLFADGSVVADRQIANSGNNAVSVGAGSWGGAQRGAARLDIGPSANVRFKLADGFGRLAVDYRLRVAGNAEPAASAALTLSAGF